MVTTKATVRRLPNYIREMKADTGELPDYWLPADLQINPPSAGSEDASPDNIMANGKSVSAPSDGLVWEDGYWNTPGDVTRYWQSADDFEADQCILWLAYRPYADLDNNVASVQSVGKFNTSGTILMRRFPDDKFDALWQNESTSDNKTTEVSFSSDVTDEFCIHIARYDSTKSKGLKLWVQTEQTSLKSSEQNSAATTLGQDKIAFNSRKTGTFAGESIEYYEFAATEAAPSDSYVENTLIPALEAKYL